MTDKTNFKELLQISLKNNYYPKGKETEGGFQMINIHRKGNR